MNQDVSASAQDEGGMNSELASLLAMGPCVIEVQSSLIDDLKRCNEELVVAVGGKNTALDFARERIYKLEDLLAEEKRKNAQLEIRMRREGLPAHGYNLRKRKK